MLKTALIGLSAVALISTSALQPARADGGRITAGVIGGLAAGAAIGAIASQPRGYYYDGPAYAYGPGPSYAYCHIERHRWVDDWGRMHIRRVRVCD